MKLSVIVFSPWFMKKEDKNKVTELCYALRDFEISVAEYDAEDVSDDKTGKVLKNILSGNPCVFVCVNTEADFVEFLAKYSHTPLVAVDVCNSANAVGKSVRVIISAISTRILCVDSAQ